MKGNKKLIEHLNARLAEELTAINQYMVHSEMCDGWGYGKLHKQIEKRAIDEMKHAEKLIARILYLEGLPIVSDLNKIHIGAEVPKMHENDRICRGEGHQELQREHPTGGGGRGQRHPGTADGDSKRGRGAHRHPGGAARPDQADGYTELSDGATGLVFFQLRSASAARSHADFTKREGGILPAFFFNPVRRPVNWRSAKPSGHSSRLSRELNYNALQRNLPAISPPFSARSGAPPALLRSKLPRAWQ